MNTKFWDDEDQDDLLVDRADTGSFSFFTRQEWSTFFGPQWEITFAKFPRGLYGRKGKLIRMATLLAQGHSRRSVARMTQCSKITVSRLATFIESFLCKSFLCNCGLPSSHQGWCHVRYNNSPKRKEFMRTWHRRSPADLVR